MEVKFNVRGHLMPYKKVGLTLSQFERIFVEEHGSESKRAKLFDNFKAFTTDFSEKISQKFTCWINGSFVSQKSSPRDIDFVILLDYQIVEEKKAIIKSNFLNADSLKEYNLDAYIVKIYPEEHDNYKYTKSDLSYWNDWFTKGKKNRAGVRPPKGYVEIEYKSN